MQECPYCGRENDDGSTNCRECGTCLVPEETKRTAEPVVANPRRASGRKLMIRGFISFVVGSVVTLYTYLKAVSSPFGGTYVIAFGAIIFGLEEFIRGAAAAAGNDTNQQAQQLLAYAARLEGVDRTKAVALYAEIARKFPGTRASNEAQRNVQTLEAHMGQRDAV